VPVLLALLATAAGEDQPRWPLAIMMAAGVAITPLETHDRSRHRQPLWHRVSSQPGSGPIPGEEGVAQMFWSFAMLVIGSFFVVAPIAVLVGL
jgi:hypothetical protein